MGQRQEIDHQPARRFFRELFEHPLEAHPIGVAGEQLVAIDEIEQRHGFAPQGVDHMAIVHDMGVLAGRRRELGLSPGAMPGRNLVQDLTRSLSLGRGLGR